MRGDHMAMSVREAFDKGTEAFNTHDLDAFAEIISDDVVQTAPGGIRAEGKPACIAFFANWIEAFPDAHVDIHDVVITDDVAVEEGTFSGTHNGVFHSPTGDIPPTGRAVRAEYVQVLRYRDGTFFSANLMFDRMEMIEQLGLLPAPAAAG
jgi:steroid delta-isomerase-like uncharacterized protein